MNYYFFTIIRKKSLFRKSYISLEKYLYKKIYLPQSYKGIFTKYFLKKLKKLKLKLKKKDIEIYLIKNI